MNYGAICWLLNTQADKFSLGHSGRNVGYFKLILHIIDIYQGSIWLFYLRINQLDLKFQNLTPMFEFRVEGGRYIYKLNRSPMCEYMINFIMKLKHLPEKYMMNSVLENFTILQVNNSTYKSYLLVFYIQGIC